MAEKVLGAEGGTAGDTVTAGAGNVSGLNTAVASGGSIKYDPSAAFAGALGFLVTNAAGSNAVLRVLIDAPGATISTTTTKLSCSFGVQLPSATPTEVESFWQLRCLPSSGGARMAYWNDGGVRIQPATSGASGIQLLTPAERAAVPGRWLRCTMQLDIASPKSITAAGYTINFYDLYGAKVGATATGTIDLIGSGSGTAMNGFDVGRIVGTGAARTYAFDHLALADNALYEISAPITRLTTPTVSLTNIANPASVSGTEGIMQITWANITGASRYDAYRATTSGNPAEGDWVPYATAVTSPYQFTGQPVGTFWYGVRAVV